SANLSLRSVATEVGFQPAQEDLHQGNGEHRIPCAGAECVQSYKFPTLCSGQWTDHHARSQCNRLRPNHRRLSRPSEHERSRRKNRRIQPAAQLLKNCGNRGLRSCCPAEIIVKQVPSPSGRGHCFPGCELTE